MSILSGVGWRIVAMSATVTALAACQSNGDGMSAWRVMQEQQAQQAALQQQERDDERAQAKSQPQLMLSLIRETQGQGRHFASMAYIDAYIQQFGANPEVNLLRADALRLTGQHAESEQAYRALLGGAQQAKAWHGLGLLAASQGNFGQATEDLSRAARLMPTQADVLSDLGFARIRNGDIAGARVPLGQAAELAPGNAKALANLALLLTLEGESARAQAIMDRAGLSAAAREQVAVLAREAQSRRTRAVPVAAMAPQAVPVSGGPVAVNAQAAMPGAGSSTVGNPVVRNRDVAPSMARAPIAAAPTAAAPMATAPMAGTSRAGAAPVRDVGLDHGRLVQ
ncbi:MAG: hypothetical protein ABW210_04665 [Achromobacter sp.]|jgi:Flp pilus assembly protein TadD